ncbi:MAG: hypothetical protein IKR26_04945 [Lachnospiraceae bacterium]|nr:hypothetical protein [Lachnospiraceae bacterium]
MKKNILFINASLKEHELPQEYFIKEESGQENGSDLFASPDKEDKKAVLAASDFVCEHTGELVRIGKLMAYIKSLEPDEYGGIIILTEENNVRYHAAFASFLLCDCAVPVVFAASEAETSQKTVRRAIKLIESGLAGNVYYITCGPDKKLWLHMGASRGAGHRVFSKQKNNKQLFKHFEKLSESRFFSRVIFMDTVKELDSSVLFVCEYPGMEFSKLPLYGVKAVVYKGLSTDTVPEYLAYECYRRGVPVYSADGILPEVLYAKVVTGVSIGFSGDDLDKFVSEEICGEYSF